MKLLIKHATLHQWDFKYIQDILVEDGVITTISNAIDTPADHMVDATGLSLLPSFVDLHVHFREPGFPQKEDLESGCRAAAHGGYTGVHLMPNTQPVISTQQQKQELEEKAKRIGLCKVIQSVSITNQFSPEDLSHLAGLTHVPWLTNDGLGVNSTPVLLAAMNWAKQHSAGLMLHEEDPALTQVNSYYMEDIPTERDCHLAELTGCPVHFCHVSTQTALESIAAAKKRGAPVTCEVTPHHIALTNAQGGRVAPPLRTEQHRQAVIAAVKSGLVDAIATDHAPHTPADKAAGANGFTGLDLCFAVCYTVLVREKHISLPQLSALMSKNPARLLGLPGGTIAVGEPANLVLVDLNTPFVARESDIHSKSKNSPFLGMTLYGKIQTTFWNGAIVYENTD